MQAQTAPPWDHQSLDRVLALLALVVLLPLLLATALAAWASLGRPLMFRQTRSGLGGRTFTAVKFRTMHDARDEAGRLLPDEARTTSVTRLMRKLRVDEIPQLLAVLYGELALVGPRPLLPATIDSFGALGRIRGSVRPGVTGWAQVSGNTLLSNDQKLALDIWYIEHRSLLLDLQILLETIRTVFLGERLNDARLRHALAHLVARASPSEQPRQQRSPT